MRTPPRRCRNAAERDALIERAFALGVPRDYGRVRQLRRQREPTRLACIGSDIHDRVQWLQPCAARALAAMQRTAAADGVLLQVVSAFRSIEYQLGIVERKLAAGQTMARVLEEAFAQSAAFAWLTAHAGQHGFTLSYPRGNRHRLAYEPWHWCWHARPPHLPA